VVWSYYNLFTLSSKGGVVGVDVVDEMLEALAKNFLVAEEQMVQKRIC
jgi:hypothetical protein